MSKIGLLVCGNSGIDYIDHKYDIDVIRSILLFGTEEYTDFVDITADEFYTKLANSDVVPSTAQAATGVILEQYEAMRDKGYDELLVVTLSEHLSGTYQGCVLAASMIEDCKVTVFDSKTVTYPEVRMVFEAAKMIEAGATIEEILPELERIRDNCHIYFAVNTLKYLVANGRLSGASGFVGGLLKIKPLLEVTKEGKVVSAEKIRTFKKAVARVIERVLEDIEGKDVEVFTIHAQADEEADRVIALLKEARPDLKVITKNPLTPVVGAHVGPGVVGIGYIVNK